MSESFKKLKAQYDTMKDLEFLREAEKRGYLPAGMPALKPRILETGDLLLELIHDICSEHCDLEDGEMVHCEWCKKATRIRENLLAPILGDDASESQPGETWPLVDGIPFDYPASARSIALNLAEWFDKAKPYPLGIADAARAVKAEIDRLRDQPAKRGETFKLEGPLDILLEKLLACGVACWVAAGRGDEVARKKHLIELQRVKRAIFDRIPDGSQPN